MSVESPESLYELEFSAIPNGGSNDVASLAVNDQVIVDPITALNELHREHPEVEYRQYQADCLLALETARARGEKRALVQMATGLGKTTTAAADVKSFLDEQPGSRVLFLCHRNYILKQARKRFELLLDNDCTFGKLTANAPNVHDSTVLFASLQMIARHRERFDPNEFDYIIVDEGHHGKAETYEPTIDYFNPKFLLGLTATPDRADLQDIRSIFGHEVYSKSLAEALGEDLLAHPDYRVIVDDIDQEVLRELLEEEDLSLSDLNKRIFIPRRDEEIVRIIKEKIEEKGIKNPRIIGFCASIEHSERIAKLLPSSEALHSKLKDKDAKQRLFDQFHSGEIEGLITVDMFNEGVDVPDANVIIFLRNTASETIFLQQLGRGLRKTEDKDEVLILDFVANCDRLLMIEKLLFDATKRSKSAGKPARFDDPGDIDLYDLDYKDVQEAADAIKELQVGSFEFTETTRKILDLVLQIQRQQRSKFRDTSPDDVISMALRIKPDGPLRTTEIETLSKKGVFPSTSVIYKHFGSITAFQEACGFRVETIRNEDVITQALKLKPDGPLTIEEIDDLHKKGELPSRQFIRSRFGSVALFNQACGFEIQHVRSMANQEIVALAKNLGNDKPLSRQDMHELADRKEFPHPDTIRKRFGSINDFYRECGFEIVEEPPFDDMTNEEIVDLALSLKPDGPLKDGGLSELSKAGRMPTKSNLVKRFGSIAGFQRACGFKVREARFDISALTPDGLVDLALSLKPDGPLTNNEIIALRKEGKFPSQSVIKRLFGSMWAFREACGFEDTGTWGQSNEELVEKFMELGINKPLTVNEMRKLSSRGTFASPGTIINRFGSLHSFYEACGIKSNRRERIDAKSLDDKDITRLALELKAGGPLTQSEVRELSKEGWFVSTSVINQRFGSFTAFHEACGFKDKVSRIDTKAMTNDELVSLALELKRGEPINSRDLLVLSKKGEFASPATIATRFGSIRGFQKACEEAMKTAREQ